MLHLMSLNVARTNLIKTLNGVVKPQFNINGKSFYNLKVLYSLTLIRFLFLHNVVLLSFHILAFAH